MFANALKRFWWILLLRGVIAILFGIGAIVMPGISLATLLLLFAVFVLVDGVFDIAHAIGSRKGNDNWWLGLLTGLLGVVVGIFTLRAPALTAIVLLFYIAIWAIATGTARIALAIRLRKEIEGEWWLALAGLASVLFGLFVIANPGLGALGFIWYIGIWALVLGIFQLALAFKARRFGKRVEAALGA